MSDINPIPQVHTHIWREVAAEGSPFQTQTAHCRGYDVFGELVGGARWVEMMLLLLRDSLPPKASVDMLEAIAVALANPGPRDPSVHAAMCAGVGGSTAAAALMAALAVGAGRNGGAREIVDLMQTWERCGPDFAQWDPRQGAHADTPEAIDIWPALERTPGFDAHGLHAALPVTQLLARLLEIGKSARLTWLAAHQSACEARFGGALNVPAVVATAFADLGLRAEEGEMLFLLLRLPGAAAHALEQQAQGYRQFPFPPVDLKTDSETV